MPSSVLNSFDLTTFDITILKRDRDLANILDR